MPNSDRPKSVMRELSIFLDLPGQSDGINRHSSVRSVDWWSQIGLGGPGTCVTKSGFALLGGLVPV